MAKLAKGQYVELAREGEDSIWTLLGEFGTDGDHSHGTLGIINHGGTPGPLHNQIPEPDRAVDNTTIWAPDFSQALLRGPAVLRARREPSRCVTSTSSSPRNRYTVNGDVTDWVTVPFNEASYGSNYCGDIVCVRDIWRFARGLGSTPGTPSQVAAGKTAAADRGRIWRSSTCGIATTTTATATSTSRTATSTTSSPSTPARARRPAAAPRAPTRSGATAGTPYLRANGADGPGVQQARRRPVGGSSYWVGDYTVEPENGGVGVFAHEFGHDLGLPDLYDTSGNTGGAEN